MRTFRSFHRRWRCSARPSCLLSPLAHLPGRFTASTAAAQVASLSPVIHTTLADAHIHASCLLAEQLAQAAPRSLADYVRVTQEWWRLVGQLVWLPGEAEAIQDLPQFLIECVGVPTQQKRFGGSASRAQAPPDEKERKGGNESGDTDDDAGILATWEEWVWSSKPHTVPTSADVAVSAAIEGKNTSQTLLVPQRQDTMSFPEFTSLVYSYSRYHRGVRWGAAPPTSHDNQSEKALAAAYYRRRYHLHPWHGLGCPEGTAQQMPYVHLLQWMLAGPKAADDSPTDLWRRHHALEAFRLSSSSSLSFRALDVCSQSGYVTDLLLKAGAGLVVAVDADTAALGNTEATYHEHLRENRSARRDPVLLTRRCDGLPPLSRQRRDAGGSSKEERQDRLSNDDPKTADVAKTSASAAERRRKHARQVGRGYSSVEGDREATGLSDGTRLSWSADGTPFHVVYIHPPAPTSVWPILSAVPSLTASASSLTSLHRTAWWHSLLRTATADGVPPSLVLPFVPCDAAQNTAGRNPLTTLSGLRQAMKVLRADVTESGRTHRHHDQRSPGPSLLTEEGYVALVLPRTFDTDLLLQGELQGCPSLADWVVAQLDGYYDLVLRRQCAVHHTAAAGHTPAAAAAVLDATEQTLVHYPRRLQRVDVQENGMGHETSKINEGSTADTVRTDVWKRELMQLYEGEWWQDVVVLKKNAEMVQRCAGRHEAAAATQQTLLERRRQVQQALTHAADPPVEWQDSFEYNEYRPQGTNSHTSHHWTDLMPTYSYLENDFYSSPAAQRNFLAVGHHPESHNIKNSTTSTTAGYGVPSLHGDDDAFAAADGKAKHTAGMLAASAGAAANFHTVFAQELRTRRRSKLRKLALSPLQRQEWYIDEKLVKSSGARVELMNELSKWDLKDYDN